MYIAADTTVRAAECMLETANCSAKARAAKMRSDGIAAAVAKSRQDA